MMECDHVLKKLQIANITVLLIGMLEVIAKYMNTSAAHCAM